MSDSQASNHLRGGQQFSGGQSNIGNQYYAQGHISIIQNNASSQRDGGESTGSAAISHECLRSLLLTDPRDDRDRIRRRKDDLLPDTCGWVCHDEAFASWWEHAAEQEHDTQLLWLHGDAGKGKTMMMIALTEEINHRIQCDSSLASSQAMAYYFCESANASTNRAHAILRGLIYFLVIERESLLQHIVKQYRASGPRLFEDSGNLDSLWRLLRDICTDPALSSVYLFIDALDECEHGLDDLLQMMTRRDLALPGKVKWLVSSRNESHISRVLGISTDRPHISLEVNAARVSQAIERYIAIKIRDVEAIWAHQPGTASAVHSYLLNHANGTFLWVWLVCQELSKMKRRRDPLAEIERFPSDLNQVYSRMLERVQQSDDASYHFALLRAAGIAPRPLGLDEAWFVADLPQQPFQTREVVEELIQDCGSFFVIRDNILTFVHKSALDFLRSVSAVPLFSFHSNEAHAAVCIRSFETLLSGLRQNMCNLPNPGTLIDDISNDLIQRSLPVHLQYACNFWHYHCVNALWIEEASEPDPRLLALLERFFQEKLMQWMESMSLLRNTVEVIRAIRDLEKRSAAVHYFSDTLARATVDARRFMSEFRSGVELAPLQVYHAGLLFSPQQSIIRGIYEGLKDARVTAHLQSESWSSCVYMLEGHSASVSSVVCSPDGMQVASASNDKTVRIWDTDTGQSLYTLEGHSKWVSSVVFSPDGKQVASGSHDKTVRVWDAETGQSLLTLEGHSYPVLSVVFSPDGKQVASGSLDKTVHIWDVEISQSLHTLGQSLCTLEGHSDWVLSVVFSPDGKQLASGSHDKTVRVWDTETGQSLHTLEGHSNWILSVVFSPDSKQVASGSKDNTVRIWDAETGQSLHTLDGHSDSVSSVVFSPDGKQVASGSGDKTVRIWDVEMGQSLLTLEGHSYSVLSVVFSPDGKQVVSASGDKTARIWDAKTNPSINTLEGHSNWVSSVVLSPDNKQVASGSYDTTVRIWDVETGRSMHTLEGHSSSVSLVVFSPDSKQVASGSGDKTVRVWDAETGRLLHTLEGHSKWVSSVVFSPDGKQVASGSYDNTVRVWDVETGYSLYTLEGHSNWVSTVVFSPDGKHIASGSYDTTARIWDAETGQSLHTLKGHSNWISTVVLSPDSKQLASGSYDKTVRVWDVEKESVIRRLDDRFARDASQLRLLLHWEDVRFDSIHRGSPHMSPDSKWLIHPDGHYLWIPHALRPSAFASSPQYAVLGTISGKLTFLSFKP